MAKKPLTTYFTDAPAAKHLDDLPRYLGGKGAYLNRMTRELGMPVPEGFTIPTIECHRYNDEGKLRPSLMQSVWKAVTRIETDSGRQFGGDNPLLLSVRSGAPVSMPGMMDTILNLGMNDTTVEALAATTSEQFAWDSYRRFVQMYAITVGGVPEHEFIDRTSIAQTLSGGPITVDLSKLLVKTFKKVAKQHGCNIPSSVKSQLRNAIATVFDSWDTEKARTYRDIEGIPHDLGTAVNVQRMVFGNLNDNSATGVAFSRNPNDGSHGIYGDFLVNAQGEDVVAGTHATQPISDMATAFPDLDDKFNGIVNRLETEMRDMVDIEFTIENGKLFMLQARVGKRNPQAAIKIATDMLSEGIINDDEAKERIDAAHTKWESVKQDTNNTVTKPTKAASVTGLAASPGFVQGIVALTSERAAALSDEGKDVILTRFATDPADILGMSKSVGILTANGGLVSHAAVVARGWGKPCVVGAASISIGPDYADIGGTKVREGDTIAIDGATGEVWVI